MTRVVSIEGGGDWNDASYSLLDVPADLDIEAEKDAWRSWYRDEYVPTLRAWQAEYPSVHGRPPGPDFIDFEAWLIRKGAKPFEVEKIESP